MAYDDKIGEIGKLDGKKSASDIEKLGGANNQPAALPQPAAQPETNPLDQFQDKLDISSFGDQKQ